MKKLFICLALLISVASVYAIDTTRQQAIEELKDKGYLYGCNPANWSLSEPVRGGFIRAAMRNEVDVMQLQVKAGLDITSCGKNLPAYLIMKNKPEALDFMLKNGYNANNTIQGYSYLNLATHYKKPQMARVIIDNGADVNLITKNIHPLNYAIKKKQAEIVEMLLNAGATENEKTEQLVAKTKDEDIKQLFKK